MKIAEIGTPPAPALVADSLTATSLRLEWKGVDIRRRVGSISYLVQYTRRYEKSAETWQYCRNQSWGDGNQILVENLQPYTNYKVCENKRSNRKRNTYKNYTSCKIILLLFTI